MPQRTLGDGLGSGYLTGFLDLIQTYVDVTSPDLDTPDRADAEFANDVLKAIKDLQTALGVSPWSTSATIAERIAGIRSLVGATIDALVVSGANIGIGTTSPKAPLHVSGLGNNTPSPSNTTSSNGVARFLTNNGVYFDIGASSGVPIWSAWIQSGDIAATSYYPLLLNPNGGNVGIGTTSPKAPLHVIGLPIYANNAAAITGGLTAGAFYRTGADPDLVCVVH